MSDQTTDIECEVDNFKHLVNIVKSYAKKEEAHLGVFRCNVCEEYIINYHYMLDNTLILEEETDHMLFYHSILPSDRIQQRICLFFLEGRR